MDKNSGTSSPASVPFTAKWTPDFAGNPYIGLPTPLPAGWPLMPARTPLPGELVTAPDGSQTVVFTLPPSSSAAAGPE